MCPSKDFDRTPALKPGNYLLWRGNSESYATTFFNNLEFIHLSKLSVDQLTIFLSADSISSALLVRLKADY